MKKFFLLKKLNDIQQGARGKMKTTKASQVLKHLEQQRSITSYEAFKLYGATRLSSIIFVLREKGYDIVTLNETSKDRNGNTCNYARYVLKAGAI